MQTSHCPAVRLVVPKIRCMKLSPVSNQEGKREGKPIDAELAVVAENLARENGLRLIMDGEARGKHNVKREGSERHRIRHGCASDGLEIRQDEERASR